VVDKVHQNASATMRSAGDTLWVLPAHELDKVVREHASPMPLVMLRSGDGHDGGQGGEALLESPKGISRMMLHIKYPTTISAPAWPGVAQSPPGDSKTGPERSRQR